MLVKLDSNTNIPALKKLLGLKTPEKGFDAKKFCGVLKTKEDALLVQKNLRNEWK